MVNTKLLSKVLFFAGCLLIGLGISWYLFPKPQETPRKPEPPRPQFLPAIRGITFQASDLRAAVAVTGTDSPPPPAIPQPSAPWDSLIAKLHAANITTVLIDTGSQMTLTEQNALVDEMTRLQGLGRELTAQKIHWGVRLRMDPTMKAAQEKVLALAGRLKDQGASLLAVGPTGDSEEISPELWPGFLKAVRQSFGGAVVYVSPRAELSEVTWWDACDYVGVAGPYALSAKKQPTDKELNSGWDAQLIEINSIAHRASKTAILFDVVYPPFDSAAKNPEITFTGKEAQGHRDLDLQERCYASVLVATKGQSDLAGLFLSFEPHHKNGSLLPAGNLMTLLSRYWPVPVVVTTSTAPGATTAIPKSK